MIIFIVTGKKESKGGETEMLKQTVFNLDEDLRTQFKLATIQRRTTIKAVLTDMVKKYVRETEDIVWGEPTKKGDNYGS